MYLGWVDSELYGSKYYETPNLTRLAKEGMHFTDTYAASPLVPIRNTNFFGNPRTPRSKLT